jgi:hypothetical protein
LFFCPDIKKCYTYPKINLKHFENEVEGTMIIKKGENRLRIQAGNINDYTITKHLQSRFYHVRPCSPVKFTDVSEESSGYMFWVEE